MHQTNNSSCESNDISSNAIERLLRYQLLKKEKNKSKKFVFIYLKIYLFTFS